MAAGAFDGVHKGHQKLIRAAENRAKAMKGTAFTLTFDPHPSRVLLPDSTPRLLTSTAHKLRILHGLGVEGCVLVPFTLEFSRIEPEQFVEQLCEAAPSLKAIIVGPNWTFGHRARGNTDLMRELASKHGLEVIVPDAVSWNGAPISSTRIRQAVEHGQLEDTESMLGRPFSMLGTVTHGRRIGRELGFPTANIRLYDEVRPPSGVYAVISEIDGANYKGAAYLGKRPSSSGQNEEHVLEAHFFDISIDLYGKEIEVFFMDKLRGNQRFPNDDLLKAQIAKDIDQARKSLS